MINFKKENKKRSTAIVELGKKVGAGLADKSNKSIVGLISLGALTEDHGEVNTTMLKDIAEKTLEHVTTYPMTSALIGGAIIIGGKAIYDTLDMVVKFDEHIAPVVKYSIELTEEDVKKITATEKIKYLSNPRIESIEIINKVYITNSDKIIGYDKIINAIDTCNTILVDETDNDKRMKAIEIFNKECQENKFVTAAEKIKNMGYADDAKKALNEKQYGNFDAILRQKIEYNNNKRFNSYTVIKDLVDARNKNMMFEVGRAKNFGKLSVVAVATGVVVAGLAYTELFEKAKKQDDGSKRK